MQKNLFVIFILVALLLIQLYLDVEEVVLLIIFKQHLNYLQQEDVFMLKN